MTSYNVTNSLVNTDPETMFREVEAAEKKRDSTLVHYDKLLRNVMATEDFPEALTHQYLSYMTPRIVQENPTVAVTSRIGGDDLVIDQALAGLEQAVLTGAIDPRMALEQLDEIEAADRNALASQHGLKRWIEQEDIRGHLDKQCDLYLKGYAISKTRNEPVRNDINKRWPKTCVIEPRRMLIDAAAMIQSEAAWFGDWYTIPKPRLEQMAKDDIDGEGGWIQQAIAELTPSKNDKDDVDRQEVRVYELWLPHLDMNEHGDPDVNGTILTLGARRDGSEGESGVEIRKPRPAYVPPWGPYTMYGCYNRDRTVWPMSPLLATFAQQEELQKHAKAMNINARQYKRVVIVSDSNPALVQQLRSAPDHLVIAVKDDQFTKDKVISIELGGISDQQLAQYAHIKRGVERAMGMDDTQSGRVDSDATATAVAVADESVATRVSYIEGKFISAVRHLLRTVLWYMVMDERVSFRLGSDVSRELQMMEPWFQGGLKTGEKFDFDDLELVIDPYSMGRVSEQALQRRVTEFVQLLLTMAPAMQQIQYINWRIVVRALTQVLNLPGMDQAIDFEQLKQIGMMQAQMGIGMVQEMSGDGAARQAKDSKPPMSNAQQLIQNRVGGKIGNLNYKGAA